VGVLVVCLSGGKLQDLPWECGARARGEPGWANVCLAGLAGVSSTSQVLDLTLGRNEF
jgi:hypothetical protein